jgi:hypothetical protein
MSKGKGNLIPREIKGLKYSTVGIGVRISNGKEVPCFKVDWLGDHDMDADEVAQRDKEVQKGGDTKIGRMKLWVRSELEKGPRLATEMYRMGEQEFGKDTDKTLKRAQVEIGGLTTKVKPYTWYLPGHEPKAPTIVEDPKIPETEVM